MMINEEEDPSKSLTSNNEAKRERSANLGHSLITKSLIIRSQLIGFASNSLSDVRQPPRDASIAPSHCAQLPAEEACSCWVGNETFGR